jgi:hypothetical protein
MKRKEPRMKSKSQTHEDALVLEVRNVHGASSGVPPAIKQDSSSDVYVGYFENEHGEQWTVQIDHEARTGVLRGGDYGWDNPVTLKDSRVEEVILGPLESAWLMACWYAATGEPLAKPAWNQVMELLSESSAGP